MHNPAILYPLFALAAWTLIVLALIPVARVRAGRRREIVTDDFKFGESSRVPGYVSIPNRNYMCLNRCALAALTRSVSVRCFRRSSR